MFAFAHTYVVAYMTSFGNEGKTIFLLQFHLFFEINGAHKKKSARKYCNYISFSKLMVHIKRTLENIAIISLSKLMVHMKRTPENIAITYLSKLMVHIKKRFTF